MFLKTKIIMLFHGTYVIHYTGILSLKEQLFFYLPFDVRFSAFGLGVTGEGKDQNAGGIVILSTIALIKVCFIN